MCCYSSRIGCVLYFDDVIYDKCLCEPTMLFLLGLDAITMPMPEDLSDDEIDNWLRYLTVKREVVGDLYDSIIDYLSLYYKIVSNEEDSITFDVNGMKLFMNQVTGTGTDRIVPVVFHEHEKDAILNIDEDDKYNDLAAKILNVFNFAGYDVADKEVSVLGKSYITDEDTLKAIDEYNSSLIEEHHKKTYYRNIYKMLDYKAMYSYALGVLCGCKCLGYSDIIWRTDPSDWYDGDYTNLINTAYNTFKWHYKHPLPKIDRDIHLLNKYKATQVNYIWNFDVDSIQLKGDEKNCFVAYIDENSEVVTEDIIYSQSTGPQKPIPGSYLVIEEDTYTWQPLDGSVICSDPKKGIIHKCDPVIVRYIANDEVTLRKAYKYGKSKFLSPNSDELYFCFTGNLGWVNFDEHSFITAPSSDFVPLSFVAKSFSDLPQDRFGNVVSKDTGEVVGYYMADVTTGIHLYGIMSGKIDIIIPGSYVTEPMDVIIAGQGGSYVTEPLDVIADEHSTSICDCACCKNHCNNHSKYCNCAIRCCTCGHEIVDGKPCYYREDESEKDNSEEDTDDSSEDTNEDVTPEPVINYVLDFSNVDDVFVYILNEDEFNARYTTIPDGYTASLYYDLDRRITIYVSNDDSNYYYDGTGDALIVDSGYSLTASELVSAFTYDAANNNMQPFDLRYNEDTSSYWSKEWSPREWSSSFGDDVLISEDISITTSIYRNVELLIEDAIILTNNVGESDLICNTTCTEYGLSLGILHLSDLYTHGITQNECSIVEADPNGDPLVDEHGNFVVWYDSVKLKYWNGYANVWQDSVPIRNNTVMYDTSTNTASSISDNETDREIILHDGTVVTYEQFYAPPYNMGVIRDSNSFKLFNPSISHSIMQCYYDDMFVGGGRDCIPGVFEHWMTFDEVHAAEYRFVNSESTLYDGDSLVPVIVDDDPSD